MGSTSRFCPADLATRRSDLIVRPLPEISQCMVYRPRPARIIVLNPSCWLLLELCDGSSVEDITIAYGAALRDRGRSPRQGDAERGLQLLLDNQLISVSDCVSVSRGARVS